MKKDQMKNEERVQDEKDMEKLFEERRRKECHVCGQSIRTN